MADLSHFITSDRCRLAYRLDGPEDAPVLALSNSIATTLRMWDGQIAALSERYRVVRYDTRGHGASDAPAGAYSFDCLGRDVIELLDVLEIETCTFCRPLVRRPHRPMARRPRSRTDRASDPGQHFAVPGSSRPVGSGRSTRSSPPRT